MSATEDPDRKQTIDHALKAMNFKIGEEITPADCIKLG